MCYNSARYLYHNSARHMYYNSARHMCYNSARYLYHNSARHMYYNSARHMCYNGARHMCYNSARHMCYNSARHMYYISARHMYYNSARHMCYNSARYMCYNSARHMYYNSARYLYYNNRLTTSPDGSTKPTLQTRCDIPYHSLLLCRFACHISNTDVEAVNPWGERDTNLWPSGLQFHTLHITYPRVEAFVSYMGEGFDLYSEHADGGAVGWGTALQTGRSRVRIRMVSLEFFIDIILPAALWPWGRLSL